MKIAVIWNFNQAKEIFPNWRDGHRAALEELSTMARVECYLGDDWKLIKVKPEKYDALIFWTGASDPIVTEFTDYPAKKLLLLTTELGLPGHIRQYDVVSCESEPVLQKVKALGVKAFRGMATDTNFFTPDDSIVKDIEVFYPATFSPWKRQDLMVGMGKKLFCVGTIQPDGQGIYDLCKQAGVQLEVGYFPAEKIRDYYRRAKNVIIPAEHGSERTVLEAMSIGILPRVFPYNQKAFSYLEEFLNSPYPFPRQFVIGNYSAAIYAERVMEGLR